MNRKRKNNIKTNERRAKGEGSLTYLPNRKENPYRLSRYVPDEYGKTVRKQFYGSSEEDCVIKVEEYLRNIQIPSEIRERTISEFIIEHYNAKLAMGKIKGSTYNRKIETLKQIEKADIGQKQLREITRDELYDYFETLVNYSQSSIDKAVSTIKLAFQLAEEQKVIVDNYMTEKSMLIPNSKKGTKKVEELHRDEYVKFLDALKNYHPKGGNQGFYKLQFYIALFMGLRMGEINAISIQDVDLASRSVSITKTISKMKDGTYDVSYTPKTEAGERVLPIPEFLVCVFQKAIDDYKPNKNQLLFTKPDGSLIKTHNSYDAFRRLCKKNGIQGKTQHGLRHTFATRSNEYNMNAKALSSMMGHKKTDITYDIYVDSDLNNKRLETDKLYEKMSSDFDLSIDIEP